jgi:hypothetical protein
MEFIGHYVAFVAMALMYLALVTCNTMTARNLNYPDAGWGGFRSRLASKVAALGALGFVAGLGFIPGWERLFGFMGLFGLIGVAYMIDAFAQFGRRTTVQRR